jgi:DNA-binding response OmpR family regulator
MNQKILVIDDDATLNNLLYLNLQPKGYEVLSATSGQEGLRMAYALRPDLIVLDIMMPGTDGWQVCERLRELSDVPIIMLTAKVEQEDVIRGFQLGADDYMTKPFSPEELHARIRAVLRRAHQGSEPAEDIYDDGTLRVDLQRRQVFRRGKLFDLTPTEYRLLSCLVRDRGRVVLHEKLLEAVWGAGYLDAMDSLALYIRYLRQKLEDDPSKPRYILNRWGMGYLFAPASGAPA